MWAEKALATACRLIPDFKARLRDFLVEQARTVAEKYPNETTLMHEAYVLGALARFSESLEVLKEVLARYPQNREVRKRIGWVYFNQALYGAAHKVLDEQLKLYPDDPDAWFWLGQICRKEHNYPQAISCFIRCLKIDPWFPGANYQLGLVYQEMGRFTEAKLCFRREELINPLHEEAQAALQAPVFRLFPR